MSQMSINIPFRDELPEEGRALSIGSKRYIVTRARKIEPTSKTKGFIELEIEAEEVSK